MKKLAGSRLLHHFIFWITAYYVLYRIFASSAELLKIDLIYTGIFIFTLLPGIYLNLLLLIPKLLEAGSYFMYGIFLVVVMVLTAGFNILMFSVLVDHLLSGYYFISYYSFWDLMKFVAAVTLISTLLKLSRGWFMLMNRQRRQARAEKERTESLLQALKSQVNPHFLFNSLTGIYSMVLKQSPDTAAMVLRLSGFLRYVIYEAAAEAVDLAREIEAISDYIAIQKSRSGPEASISLSIEGSTEGKQIAPLLFLPLAENCFKHGIKGDTGPTFADFSIVIGPREVTAQFVNSKGTGTETSDTEYGGIGLKNLKQRLELLFGSSYTLTVRDEEKKFNVSLKVPLYG